MNDDRIVNLIASAQFNPAAWQRASADERFNALEDARHLIRRLQTAGYAVVPKAREGCAVSCE